MWNSQEGVSYSFICEQCYASSMSVNSVMNVGTCVNAHTSPSRAIYHCGGDGVCRGSRTESWCRYLQWIKCGLGLSFSGASSRKASSSPLGWVCCPLCPRTPLSLPVKGRDTIAHVT